MNGILSHILSQCQNKVDKHQVYMETFTFIKFQIFKGDVDVPLAATWRLI